MGMFDTLILNEQINCPSCGKEIKEIQTKRFSNLLAYYKIGDIILDEDIPRLIYSEPIYCDCTKTTIGENYFLYITIVDNILISIKKSEKEAIESMNNFSYEDIVKIYKEKNKKMIELSTEYLRLKQSIKSLTNLFSRIENKEEHIFDSLESFYIRDYIGENIIDTLNNILEGNDVDPFLLHF